MKTKLIKITDPNEKSAKKALCEAGEILKRGGLVIFPTETVYGLGGNATDATAAEKIYAAKGRPQDNPLIVHIADPGEAEKYAITNETYYALAAAFMPGPLTVILPKKDSIPCSVTGGLDTVALRCPSHPVANALIRTSGVPIAAPSANLSGKPSPTNAEYVMEDMDGRVDMVIDGGSSEIGLESTIVSILNSTVTLLRPGGITYDALTMVVGNVEIANSVTNQLAENERPLSPGMKYKHYAPKTPVILLDGDERSFVNFVKSERNAKKCAVLCYNEETDMIGGDALLPIGNADDLAAHAHNLFTYLRDADKLGCDVIYAHLPPKEGLGLALYNRLIRAAAHTVKRL